MSNGDDFGEKLVIYIFLRFSTEIIKLLLKNDGDFFRRLIDISNLKKL